jgi:diphosphomevalonate decarboxylase
MAKASAVANPNIAFIKYWGKADAAQNLPANPSLSMNLAALTTVTTVEFRPGLATDTVIIDGAAASDKARARVVDHLERVRGMASFEDRAWVVSRSDFPVGTGLASSASAFAALSLAATQAAGLGLPEEELSRLARLGSGSACRSVPSGFTLWRGTEDQTSYARQIAPPEHWDLHDVVAVVTRQHKQTGSYEGHNLAPTSPLHQARLAAVPGWLDQVQQGIEERDLAMMGDAIEQDALAMHGVMLTSQPSLFYWEPATVVVLKAVRRWRDDGLQVYFTLDAGPNVHCICRATDAEEVRTKLGNLPVVKDVLVSGPGNGVRRVAYHLF